MIYSRMIYNKPSIKNLLLSFLAYVRDVILYLWPARVPKWIRRLLLGFQPDYVFLVHPRRKEDVFRAFSFFGPLRAGIGGQRFYRFLAFFPPGILGKVEAPNGVTGLIITSSWLPEALLKNKKKSLLEIRRCLKMASHLVDPWQPIGLGGWWPIVTRRGLALKKYAQGLRVSITNGHCGTLCSLCLSIEKIARIGDLKMTDLSILIIGAGKMGTNVARMLLGKVRHISLVDRNPVRLVQIELKIL